MLKSNKLRKYEEKTHVSANFVNILDYVEIIQNGKIVIPVALWELVTERFFSRNPFVDTNIVNHKLHISMFQTVC